MRCQEHIPHRRNQATGSQDLDVRTCVFKMQVPRIPVEKGRFRSYRRGEERGRKGNLREKLWGVVMMEGKGRKHDEEKTLELEHKRTQQA